MQGASLASLPQLESAGTADMLSGVFTAAQRAGLQGAASLFSFIKQVCFGTAQVDDLGAAVTLQAGGRAGSPSAEFSRLGRQQGRQAVVASGAAAAGWLPSTNWLPSTASLFSNNMSKAGSSGGRANSTQHKPLAASALLQQQQQQQQRGLTSFSQIVHSLQ